MCYICRQQIKDYNHFSNLLPPEAAAKNAVAIALASRASPAQAAAAGAAAAAAATEALSKHPSKCPLFSDTEKMHAQDVARSEAAARAELIAQNPNIRIDLVLSKGKALATQ